MSTTADPRDQALLHELVTAASGTGPRASVARGALDMARLRGVPIHETAR